MEFKCIVNDIEVIAQYTQEDVEKIFKPLLERWTKMQREKQRRIFVFLAAPAGCGKTTLSLFLQELSKQSSFEEIQTMGMDGFHYTNAYLKAHTIHENGNEISLKDRKGSPYTFDKERLKKKLIEAKEQDNLWPIYSRKLHDPIEEQILLDKNILLLEGNYLLLKECGWEDVIEYCDDSVFITCDETILQDRIVNRKMAGGFTLQEATSFYESSDRKNIETILHHSHTANITLKMENGRFHRL